jgi:hypothetical protein
MKITIESTSKIVELQTITGGKMQARIWEGTTDDGVPVHCFITRITPTIPKDDPRQKAFVRELRETRAPSPEIDVYPLKMIL